MALIVIPHTFVPATAILSAQVNANFVEVRDKFNTYAVQTDVSKTISAVHTFSANIKFTDGLYDLGESGAFRPRHGFFSGNLVAGGNLSVTGQYGPGAMFTLTDGATIPVDFNNGNAQKVTLGGNRTMTWANPVVGGVYRLYVTQDGTGSRTLTLPTHKPAGGTAIALTTTAGKKDIIVVTWDGTDYLVSLVGNH